MPLRDILIAHRQTDTHKAFLDLSFLTTMKQDLMTLRGTEIKKLVDLPLREKPNRG